MKVADRARLLIELHEIRKQLAEAEERVKRLSTSVRNVPVRSLQGGRAAS